MKVRKIHLIRFSPLFFFFLLMACSSDVDKDQVEPVVEVLSVSVDKLLFSENEGVKKIKIVSNTEWLVSVDQTWCKFGLQFGSENETIDVLVDANGGEETRKAIVTLQTKSKEIVLKILVEQQAMSMGIPLLTINIEGGQSVLDKENYLKGALKIESRKSDGSILGSLFETDMKKDGIRGRGNSTWGMPKKPYKIKLDKSVEVLGMPANKHWVLLANYADKTLLRNELAFEISRRMGYTYTPRVKYVDLVLNGKREGNYMLCEQIRIDPDRVNISELKAGSSNISGGYLFEIDERKDDRDESEYFDTKGDSQLGYKGIIVAIKDPDKAIITVEQKEYVVAHFQKIEDALFGKSGNPVTELPKYLDINTFIDNFLINELSKNVDGNLRLSTKMYKKEDDDKLYFGPVWDYDLAFGNANYDGGDKTTDWLSRNVRWYKAFFDVKEFRDMTANRWVQLRRDKLSNSNIYAYIDEVATTINESQKINFQIWDILSIKVWPNPVATGSYKREIDYLKEFVGKRAAWMDSNIGK